MADPPSILCASYSTGYSLGCLHTTKPRPLAESVHWSMSFAAHPLAGMPYGLGNAVTWQGPSVPVPLYTAWKLPYPPHKQILSHSIFLDVPADLWASRGSQVEGPFPLSQLPPRGTGFSLIPFIFLSFRLTQLHRELSCSFGCISTLLPVFSWYFEICSTCRWVFDVFVEGGGFHVFLLCHLDLFPPILTKFWVLVLVCSWHPCIPLFLEISHWQSLCQPVAQYPLPTFPSPFNVFF